MDKNSNEKLKVIFTIIGWIIIGFAIIALILFILKSGVLA
jgi:preprotein translocase subunit Sec63